MRHTDFFVGVGLLCNVILAAACASEEGDSTDDPGTVEQLVLSSGEVAGWAYYDGTLNTSRSYNSSILPPTTGGVSVTVLGTGQYSVRFDNLEIGTTGGNAQAVAVGEDNKRCNVGSWIQQVDHVQVTVNCYKPNGSFSNSGFVVSYANFAGGTTSSSLGAYLLMDQPSGGTLDANYMWGTSATVARLSTGVYKLTFTGQTMSDGDVQVTKYGSGSEYCNIDTYSSSSATVRCYQGTGTGSAADSMFSFRYHRKQKIHDTYFGSGGFLKQSSTSYISTCTIPGGSYTFGWHGGSGMTCDFAVSPYVCQPVGSVQHGAYSVFYPQLTQSPAPQSVPMVTAQGTTTNYCKIASWIDGSGSDADVEVRCWEKTGASKVDTTFAAFFLSNWFTTC